MTMTIDDMSARYVDAKMKEAAARIPQTIVSADDHVFDLDGAHFRASTIASVSKSIIPM